MFIVGFSSLWGCCVSDKRVGCGRTLGEAGSVEVGLEQLPGTADCRHTHHDTASERACWEEMINTGKTIPMLCVCTCIWGFVSVTLNLQITSVENVRGQHHKAQGEMWELHQTGEFLDRHHNTVSGISRFSSKPWIREAVLFIFIKRYYRSTRSATRNRVMKVPTRSRRRAMKSTDR